MTTDDIRGWLDNLDAELIGCVEDLGIVVADLEDIADSLENFIESQTDRYNNYYSNQIRMRVRELESIRKRLDMEG